MVEGTRLVPRTLYGFIGLVNRDRTELQSQLQALFSILCRGKKNDFESSRNVTLEVTGGQTADCDSSWALSEFVEWGG